MKKILKHTVLFAVALASPVAMAEVTISGVVDQAYEKAVTSTNEGRKSFNRVEPTLANYGYLKFNGNEELGSGLKANYEVSFKNVGPSDSNDSIENYTSFIGLSGDFGNLKLGSQWRPFFTAIAGIDPAQLAKVPGFVGTPSLGGLSGLAPNPNRNSITYNLPSLTPGLFIQFQKGLGETATGNGDSKGMYIIFTDGAKFFATYATHEEKMVAYDGTSQAGIAATVIPGRFGASLTGSVESTDAVTTYLGVNGHSHTLYVGTGGETRKLSGAALTYNFGPVKLVYGNAKEKVVGTTAEIVLNAYGFTAPIGSNASFGYLVSNANHTRAAGVAGNSFKLNGDRMLVSYNLSKLTSAYYANGRQSLAGGTAAGNALSSAVSAVGLQHKF